MKRLLPTVLVLGLAAVLVADASAGVKVRVGNFRNAIQHHQPRVAHYCPPTYCPPVRYCYRVEYSCSHWHCRHFHCEPDARRFADYICGLGFQHRIVFEHGCFVVHFYLPHCLTRTFDHRCDADAFSSLLCGYGIHTHVIVVRH